ncbi:MAG: hypothetical protein BWX80_00775 [Candidatus Hydrogenedentes bacterium ADurb.Bin101]|nr:MAG: hypothetical protein BWX80_00775 [Candidatus Hydrogenedentes bacterium ADurb.Bin101]
MLVKHSSTIVDTGIDKTVGAVTDEMVPVPCLRKIRIFKAPVASIRINFPRPVQVCIVLGGSIPGIQIDGARFFRLKHLHFKDSIRHSDFNTRNLLQRGGGTFHGIQITRIRNFNHQGFRFGKARRDLCVYRPQGNGKVRRGGALLHNNKDPHASHHQPRFRVPAKLIQPQRPQFQIRNARKQ